MPDRLAAPWTLRLGAGTWVRRLTLETELRTRTDSVETVDSLRTDLVAEWSRLAGEGEPRLSGLLREFRLAVPPDAPATPAGVLLPIPFAALDGVGGAPVQFTRPDPAACGLDAAALQPVRELLVTPPRRLEPGTAWADSATYTICRDSIPLSVHVTRRFVARGAEAREDGVVVLVDRTSVVQLRGEGRQFGEPLTIEATGEGAMALTLQVPDGAIAEGHGTQVLQMTMRGRRRSQELTQHTRITIARP